MRLAVARMAGAIRAITVERGRDPADFALFPFGGAGPMHACDLAEELGIREVLVPVCPGNLSALGLLASDQRQELVRTCVSSLDRLSDGDLAALVAAQEKTGRTLPLLTGYVDARVRFEHAVDMRYARQAFEIPVPLPTPLPTIKMLRALFLDLYRQLYGQVDSVGAIEIVNLRTVAIGVTDKPRAREIAAAQGAAVSVAHRPVRLRGKELPWPIYDRATLGAGHAFAGPAIVEEANSTTIVLPDWSAQVDRWGNLRLKR